MPAIDLAANATGGHMIPRPVLVVILAVLVLLLSADVGGALLIPGHSASPVLDGGILAIIGTVFTAARGPRPQQGPPGPPPDARPPDPWPPDPPVGPRGTAELPRAPSGRHHLKGR